MQLCINCGSDKVDRQGDDFTCRKCQFGWNVAFEQANKVYLRSQGRQPATSVLETPGNTPAVVSSAVEPAEQGGPAGEPEKPTADPTQPPSATTATHGRPESTTKPKKG